MDTRMRRLDQQLELPNAPTLHATDPLSTRVIAVMPLAYNFDGRVCLVPGSQAAALNIAFQLARVEVERTLGATHPEHMPWLNEHGRMWPWLMKEGVVPNPTFLADVYQACELVKLAILGVETGLHLSSSHAPHPSFESHLDISRLISVGHTLFVYERDDVTIGYRTYLESISPGVSFYEILNLVRGEGMIKIHP